VVVSQLPDSCPHGASLLLRGAPPPRAAAPPHMLSLRVLGLHSNCRNYPWSLYAVFQTTITQWAFLYDCLLTASFYCTLCEAGYYSASDNAFHAEKWERNLLWALFIGYWLFSRTIKLVPHLLRNPGDVRFVPLSVLFGYFHNLIKLYGCITVTEVC
jgi:hypothetical protein